MGARGGAGRCELWSSCLPGRRGGGADALARVFSCRSGTTDYDLVGGEQLHCHFGSILHTTGLQYRDFIHISFHDKVSMAAPHRFSGSQGPSRL